MHNRSNPSIGISKNYLTNHYSVFFALEARSPFAHLEFDGIVGPTSHGWLFQYVVTREKLSRFHGIDELDAVICFGCRQSRFSFLAAPTTPHNTDNSLGLGVSFSSGLPGWFLSCFFVDLLRISVSTHKCIEDFSVARRSAWDVIFGRPWGSGWVILRNPNLFRVSVSTHRFH